MGHRSQADQGLGFGSTWSKMYIFFPNGSAAVTLMKAVTGGEMDDGDGKGCQWRRLMLRIYGLGHGRSTGSPRIATARRAREGVWCKKKSTRAEPRRKGQERCCFKPVGLAAVVNWMWQARQLESSRKKQRMNE